MDDHPSERLEEQATLASLAPERRAAPISNVVDHSAGHAVPQGWWLLAFLSLLMGFASISTDVYLPAMPTMERALGGNPGSMEWTVSGYLIGFSLGQLLWGPISDRYGRRPPVAAGLMLFAIGSAGCAMANSVPALIGFRVVQAVGACAGVVLSRAMVRDLYEGHRAAQMLSTLITVMAIAPLLGPIVGGQILLIAGWRAIFVLLVAIGITTLLALLTVPETLQAERRNQKPLARALIGYGELLAHRRLLGYAGAGGFFYAGMFAYVAGTPFAYITYHHVPVSLYGLLFGAGILGIMAANMANARLVRRFGPDALMRGGALLATAAGLVVAVDAYADWGGIWGLFMPLFGFASATGFIVANSIVGAMGEFPQRAGAVSALVGAAQYGSGVIGSSLVGAFADGTPWPLGWVISATSLGSLLCAWLLVPSPARTFRAD